MEMSAAAAAPAPAQAPAQERQSLLGSATSARTFWQKVVERDPSNEAGWLGLASFANSDEEAIGYLRRVLEINPQNEQALVSLHKTLVNEGIRLAKADNRSRARWLLMEASALNPNSELVWLSLAAVVEKPADAVRCLQKVLKINPNNEQAITCLNQIYAKVGSPEPTWQCPLCLSSFQMEMANCPQCRSMLALNDLDAVIANQAADRNVLHEALRRFQEHASREETPGAYYHMALAFLNGGQVAEGLNALRRASQLQPEDQGLKNLIVALQQRQAQSYGADAKTILVIDDSPTVCKLVSLSLEQHGHRVLVASEMMEALAKLNETKLDLILLDIMLPGADGYQVCKIIKGYATTKSVPVVMLSGRDGFFDKMRARLVGAQGYITKPFVPNDLLKAVEKHCKKSK